MALATDPVDMLLDPLTEDIVVTTDLQFSKGLDAVSQGIRVRIKEFKGEWFANLDEGVPYFQDVLGQKYNAIKVRNAFRPAIVDTPGVGELLSLGTTFNGATREVRVNWEARAEFDDTIPILGSETIVI